MRGAWIEIINGYNLSNIHMSLPMRGAWIEIRVIGIQDIINKSLPMRGAWIEILGKRKLFKEF